MLYILANPHAGEKKAEKLITRISADCPQLEYQVFLTQQKGDEERLIQEILPIFQEKEDTLLIIGGDGTLSKTLFHLPENSTFAYLPAGSGNDFARGIGGLTYPQVMTAVLEKRTQPITIFQSQEHALVNSLGVGYDARVIAQTEQSQLKEWLHRIGLGKLVYILYGVLALFSRQGVSVMVINETGQEMVCEDLFLFSLANTAYFGGGICICPQVSVTDGVLHLTCIQQGHFFHRVAAMVAVLVKKQATSPRFIHKQVKSAVIVLKNTTTAQIDGELVQVASQTFSSKKLYIYQ